MMKITRVFVLLLAFLISFSACGRVKSKTKEVIGKTGEAVGEGSTEFINGVSNGVDQSLECNIELSQALLAKGVKVGKFVIPDSGSTKNTLSVFIAFEQAFNQAVTVSVFDEKGREYGRTTLDLSSEAGEGKFVDFLFDSRTDIEHRSKFVLK